jgi:hypothetical protein
VAAHKGFKALDTVAHVLTALTADPAGVHLAQPAAVPNPNWLRPRLKTGTTALLQLFAHHNRSVLRQIACYVGKRRQSYPCLTASRH